MSGVVVEVSAKKVWFPFECACCSGYPETELRARPRRTVVQRLTHHRSHGITVPYCRRCVEHCDRWTFAMRASTAMTAAAAATSIVIGIAVAITPALVAGAAGVAAGLVIGRGLRRAAIAHSKHSCARPGQAVECLRRSRHRGVFAFSSPRYAAKFAIQNASQLRNIDGELRALIEQHRTRGDSSQVRALPAEDSAEMRWVTTKPRKRRWWQDSSISVEEATRLSL
jgi:hypothetical protein